MSVGGEPCQRHVPADGVSEPASLAGSGGDRSLQRNRSETPWPRVCCAPMLSITNNGAGSIETSAPTSSLAQARTRSAAVSRKRMIPPGTCHPVPKNSSSRQVSSVRGISSWMSRSTLTRGMIRLTKRNTSSGSPRRASPTAASILWIQRLRETAIGSPLRIEVDALLFDNERTVANLRVDRADILSQHTKEEELHGCHAEQADDDRSHANRQVVPEQHLHHEIDRGGNETQHRTDEADDRGQPQRDA